MPWHQRTKYKILFLCVCRQETKVMVSNLNKLKLNKKYIVYINPIKTLLFFFLKKPKKNFFPGENYVLRLEKFSSEIIPEILTGIPATVT